MTKSTDMCELTRSRLDDWLDDLLDPNVQAEVDEHLAKCPACAQFFDRHRGIEDDLLALAAAADRLADASAHPRVRGHTGWRKAVGIAAVVAILVTAGIVTVGSRGTGDNNRQVAGPPPTGTDGAGLEEPRATQNQNPIEHSNVFAVATTGNDHRMAVEMESNNPRIHVVWFYNQVLPKETPGEVENNDVLRASDNPKGV